MDVLPTMETIRELVLAAESKRRWFLKHGASEEEAAELCSAEMELAQLIALRDLTYDALLHHSGMVVRAEGREVSEWSASLSVVDRLFSISNRRLRGVATEIDHSWRRDLSFALAGVAPGSFCFGIRAPFAESDPSLMLGDQETTGWERTAEEAMRTTVSACVAWVENGAGAVREVVEDPAVRDAVLLLLHDLAPPSRGRRRISRIAVERENHRPSRDLGPEDRQALKHALGIMETRRRGAFIGEVREADLDARRFELRRVREVGSIRCIAKKGVDLKELLGRKVQVSGEYETDKSGRPRLMQVEDIRIMEDASLPIADDRGDHETS